MRNSTVIIKFKVLIKARRFVPNGFYRTLRSLLFRRKKNRTFIGVRAHCKSKRKNMLQEITKIATICDGEETSFLGGKCTFYQKRTCLYLSKSPPARPKGTVETRTYSSAREIYTSDIEYRGCYNKGTLQRDLARRSKVESVELRHRDKSRDNGLQFVFISSFFKCNLFSFIFKAETSFNSDLYNCGTH